MPGIRVGFHPILDDPTNPDERVIAVYNGLSEVSRPPDHQRVVLCVKRLYNHHLEITPLELTDSVTFRVPRENRTAEAAVEAFWVNAPEGIWLVLDEREVTPVMSARLKPFLSDFVADIFRSLGRPLVWKDDVDDESGDLP